MTPGIVFSSPYHRGPQHLVARIDDPIETIEQLSGRTVVVRRSSAYWRPLERLRREGIRLRLEAAPEGMETEDIILKVGAGEFDLTVAGGPIADLELGRFENVRAAFPIGGGVPSAWAVREENPKLRAALRSFFDKERRGLFLNMTYRKYFRSRRRLDDFKAQKLDPALKGALCPYDEIVRRFAVRYDFDWRLIVALIREESEFDPGKASWAGALGLMQIMPRTARELGFRDVREPARGIHAGVKYLSWLRSRFSSELPMADRTWFALAAYNAGLGHVQDARRLAERRGWDPSRWFGNVERAVLLLSSPKIAAATRHGYFRGAETVQYVQNIRDRYELYVRHIEGRGAAGLL